jgi:hypothetical protein
MEHIDNKREFGDRDESVDNTNKWLRDNNAFWVVEFWNNDFWNASL